MNPFDLTAPEQVDEERDRTWSIQTRSSARTGTGQDDFGTPAPLVQSAADAAFGGVLPSVDLCALAHNRKAERYVGPDHEDVRRRCILTVQLTAEDRATWGWLNPPFSKIRPILTRARRLSAEYRFPIGVLIPLRPSTLAWKSNVWPHASRVLCADRRIAFLEPDGTPMTSVILHDVALVVFVPGVRTGDAPKFSLWHVQSTTQGALDG